MGKEFLVCEKRDSGVKLDERASFMLELMKETIVEHLKRFASGCECELGTDFHFSFRARYSKTEFRDLHSVSIVVGEKASPDQCDDWIKATTGGENRSDAETGFGWIVFIGDRGYHIETGVVWNGCLTNEQWTEELVHNSIAVLKENGFWVD